MVKCCSRFNTDDNINLLLFQMYAHPMIRGPIPYSSWEWHEHIKS